MSDKVAKFEIKTSSCASCATFLFFPHFHVICDLLPNRRTATWNLFVKCIFFSGNIISESCGFTLSLLSLIYNNKLKIIKMKNKAFIVVSSFGSQSFSVLIQPLSTRLIKPNFCFDLSHRSSTTVSLETRSPV